MRAHHAREDHRLPQHPPIRPPSRTLRCAAQPATDRRCPVCARTGTCQCRLGSRRRSLFRPHTAPTPPPPSDRCRHAVALSRLPVTAVCARVKSRAGSGAERAAGPVLLPPPTPRRAQPRTATRTVTSLPVRILTRSGAKLSATVPTLAAVGGGKGGGGEKEGRVAAERMCGGGGASAVGLRSTLSPSPPVHPPRYRIRPSLQCMRDGHPAPSPRQARCSSVGTTVVCTKTGYGATHPEPAILKDPRGRLTAIVCELLAPASSRSTTAARPLPSHRHHGQPLPPA
jgi:hypothetical protein